ncbi:MAG: sensor domain-containing phosphodiesterase, partial [Pseudomonadota bacterium]
MTLEGVSGSDVRLRALSAWPIAMLRAVAAIAILVAALIVSIAPARALNPIEVTPNSDRIEITASGEFHARRGESLQVETAPGVDGATGRMTVSSSLKGANPDWVVFALRNVSERVLTFWITADRYTHIGSGITWPDLDARRIEALTPSIGFLAERVPSDRADIFRITIEPGQTITYAAEMSADKVARIYLWQPTSFQLKTRDRQLLNGFLLGVVGILGVFLTAVFAANHKAIFPSAALVAWSLLAYLCVDFGFWHKLLQLRAEDNAVYRAATESAVAASLLIFAYTFLRLRSSHSFIRMIFGVWIIAQVALVFLAVLDPRLSATFARLSFAAIGGVCALVMILLAARGQDRSLSLLPPWILFLVWVFGASLTVTGKLSGDLVVSIHVAGLVLIAVLIGFTVTQYAFKSSDPIASGTQGDQAARALAVEGAAAAVWEWHGYRNEVRVSPLIEAALGLDPGILSAKLDTFTGRMHPADGERFHAALDNIRDKNGGVIQIDFRMRHAGNYWRWFSLDAATVHSTDGRSLRCYGLIRDITDERRAQDRLLHDAVHDGMTGLPNRELFVDRLEMSLARTAEERCPPPAVVLIDIDHFRRVNATHGFVVGDSVLLTLARRLQSHVGPQDSLARIGGNQFGLILQQQTPETLAALSDDFRKAVRTPIQVSGHDIILTGAIGIAIAEPGQTDPNETMKDAEIALYRAKRAGTDRIQLFRPELRTKPDDASKLAAELKVAIERQQIEIVFNPIIYLPTEVLSGFEATLRWRHPQLGLLQSADFMPVAERHDLAAPLMATLLRRAATEAAKWQKQLHRNENPLFASIGLSSRQLINADLVQEVRRIVSSAPISPGTIRLAVAEDLVMDNPEQVSSILDQLREAGARIALDDFGIGYSSLAYLQRFPFDTIKLDGDLVQASADDGAGQTLVRSIVGLGRELGKRVIAEGVDTPESAMFLRSLGCEYAQGFYYGEAMTVREVTDLLRVVRKAERKQQRSLFLAKPSPMPKPEVSTSTAKKVPDAAIAAAEAAAPAANDVDPATVPPHVVAKGKLPARVRKAGGSKRGARQTASGPERDAPNTSPPPPPSSSRPPVSPNNAPPPPPAANGNGHVNSNGSGFPPDIRSAPAPASPPAAGPRATQ